MINCEKLNAVVPESTCIARQRMIHDDRIKHSKSNFILSCKGCKIGEKLWENNKKMIKKTKAERIKIKPSDPRICLHINLKSTPGLWAVLKELADEELRTPQDQALWILKETLL